MKKREVLGKGLAALIPEIEESTGKLNKDFFFCGIEEIKLNPSQPRQSFNEETISQLAKSLKNKGILQPLLVRGAKNGGYELIVGERRWRAAQKAGIADIPVIIKDISNKEALELSLIENIQREDLNPIDEAEAYKNLLSDSSLTQEELSLKLGKDRSTISNYLRLLKLHETVKSLLSNYTISVGHAIALLGLEDQTLQLNLCKRIVSDNLSVRQVERIVKQTKCVNKKEVTLPGTKHNKDLSFLADGLMGVLGTQVKIISRKKGGVIEIKFYSEDDLNRIVDILRGLGR
jgi:ParB family chromosome partitioning protein